MPQFVKRRPLVVIILLVVLLIALVIITSGQRENVTLIEGAVGEVLTPIQGFMYRIATSISNYIQAFSDRRQLKENYELLQARVLQLELQLLDMNETEKENKRLQGLLHFIRERETLVVSGARVTGKNPGNWFNVITIDQGANQGIIINMAVVTNNGLVGRIIDVGPNWSKVRAVVDGQSSVSGLVERTRDTGMVRGNNGLTFEDGLCRMIHLPLDSDITVGDQVITSGLGEIFPKGIYIGEVIEVIHERRDLYKTAVVKPGVDFHRLEEVLVIQSVQE